MGPWSEKKQIERAEAIQRLLESNPKMGDYMKAIWKKHAMNLAGNEEEYNARVKAIYSNIKKSNLISWN